MDDVNVIRIRRLLKTETDAELTRDLQTLTTQRDAAQKQVERYAEEIEHIKAELVRRQLAEYWLAHPELTAVAVGDRLLVTKELLDYRELNGGYPKRANNVEKICTLRSFDNVDVGYCFVDFQVVQVD